MRNKKQKTDSRSQRILISAALNIAGGVETHLQQLCWLLSQQGAEVTLIARAATRENALVRDRKQWGVQVITTPFSFQRRLFRLSTAYAMTSLPLRLRRGSFDVLYTVFPSVHGVSRFTGFLSRFVKPGGQILANPVGPSDRVEANQSLPVLTGIIAETAQQAFGFQREYGRGLPVAAMPHLGFAVMPPARKPFAGNELRLAMVGRLDTAKGIYRMLDLWPKLDIQPARLHFLGSGLEEARLRQEIRRRGFAHQVQVDRYNGRQVDEVFANIDLVVLPSSGEGLPLVLLEAIAYGIPFVATQVGMVRILAEGNPDVRVVPTDDFSIKLAIEEMAREIRSGRVRPERLQEYHRSRYSFEHLSKRWLGALLDADAFWRRRGGVLPEGGNAPTVKAVSG